jgi:alpha-L-fucosidase
VVITRRNFIKTGGVILAGAALRPQLGLGADEAGGVQLALPTPAQVAWQDYEIGLLYSFDLGIAAGDTTMNNAARKTWDPNLYQPRKLDTDQWLEAAKACGARYAIFTATHFNGFMQWQSDLYPYGLKQTNWRGGKGDVVADFIASCRKAGIKPGIYFSVNRNVYQEVWDHYADWGKGRGTAAQEQFNRLAEKMMEELCTRYGSLIEIWFDAGTLTPAEGGPDLLPIFEKHQPDAVFYSSTERSDHRWIGNEAGRAGYPCWATMPGAKGAVSHNAPGWKNSLGSGDPDGAVWSPGMVDVPLRGANKTHNWFWAPNQDEAVQPADRLTQMYLDSVGRNCNLVIGEVITPDGLVPDSDIKRLAEFGREIQRRWGKPIAETNGTGARVELKLPAAARIGSIVIMEDITHGERIQSYTLAGKLPGGDWQELARGQSVGHKRIEKFPAIEVSAVRLQVDQCKAAPRIRRLAA